MNYINQKGVHMDDILEFILELILESGVELSSNKKITKWIRYPIIFIISILFIASILLIFFLGVVIYKESIALSIAFIILSIALSIGGINKFKKIYLEKKENQNTNNQ